MVARVSESLILARRVVEGRMRRLHQKINDELGFHDQRLRFQELSMRQGAAVWSLRNQNNDALGETLPRDCVAALALASDAQSTLFFAYNEEWQLGRRKDQVEFVSSNLRFAISGDDAPDLQFRLEWAGAKTTDDAISFPGRGAAHPHWQFDVDNAWFGSSAGAVSRSRASVAILEIDLEPEVEAIDLVAPEVATGDVLHGQINSALSGFHRLHLPVRALWHESMCEMPEFAEPQQHTPKSETEIDNWMLSSLRYLKHEFETYL